MTIKFKRISSVIIIVLAILCLGSAAHHSTVQSRLIKTKATGVILAHKTRYTRKHAHRPVLTKTVPSSYKKMMVDGKNVAKAEQVIMKQTNGGKKKANANNSAYKSALNTLDENVGQKTQSWPIDSAWSPFPNDRVKIMPGLATASGRFDSTFVIYDAQAHNRIDGIYLASYVPSIRRFVNVNNYGVRQFKKQKPQLAKKLKLQLIKRNHKHPQKRAVKGDAAHVR